MDIQLPTYQELSECFNIEQGYAFDVLNASEQGFFLPGASFTVYEDLFESGYIRVAKAKNGVLAAFVVIVPPKHTIVHRLLVGNPALVMQDNTRKTDPDSTAWIAKVAVHPMYCRQGFSAALYKQAFLDFSGYQMMTATALSPIHNKASEGFHKGMGMKVIGQYFSGTKGPLENTVNTVWGITLAGSRCYPFGS